MNKRAMMAYMMTAVLMIGACGCAKKVSANKADKADKTKGGDIPISAVEARDLEGNPDLKQASERGLMNSLDAKNPVLSDIKSCYSVINYELYSKIVSGSELTVEPIIRDERDTDCPEEMTMYVFAYNDEYAWDFDNAYAKIVGSPIRCIIDQDYNTMHVYWFKGNLPKDMPTGKYTMVFVGPDGKVDSMADFDLVQPSEAPAPVGID